MPKFVQLNEMNVTARSWELDKDAVLFGRGGDAQAKIDDRQMSRHHFQIAYDNGVHVITDQNSTNGTWVNGRRVDSSPLHDNDQVRAGNARFVYHIGTSTMLGLAEQRAGQSFQSALQGIYRGAGSPRH